jgi:hypothetical protein
LRATRQARERARRGAQDGAACKRADLEAQRARCQETLKWAVYKLVLDGLDAEG